MQYACCNNYRNFNYIIIFNYVIFITHYIGSVDCTRLHYARCPNSWRHDYIGKEGHPALTYLAVVDHRRKIYYVSIGYPGGWNDRSISDNDEFILSMKRGLYSDFNYFLYNEDACPIKCSGAHLIADGGFHKTSIFMDPLHNRFVLQHVTQIIH